MVAVRRPLVLSIPERRGHHSWNGGSIWSGAALWMMCGSLAALARSGGVLVDSSGPPPVYHSPKKQITCARDSFVSRTGHFYMLHFFFYLSAP